MKKTCTPIALIGLCFAAILPAAGAQPVVWTTWTSATPGTPGSAAGTLGTGTVSYAGDNQNLYSDPNIWLPVSTYSGGPISNPPPAGSVGVKLIGGTGNVNTVTFSSPVTNPVMGIVSLGQPQLQASFNFTNAEPFTILACGPSADFGGVCIVQSSSNVLGNEGSGTIQFTGTFTSLTWTNPTAENFYVFTVGAPVQPPAITKSFTPGKIIPGGTSALSLSISNPNTLVALAGVAFTDTLPANLVIGTPNGLASTCGGTATAVAGSGTVSLNGGNIAASGTCTVTVSVTAPEGNYVNSTTVTSTNGGAGNTSSATLSVASAPVISKSFGEVSIGPLNTVGLTFSIRNPNTATTLTGIAFTDTLPAGLKVSSPSVVTGVCDAGTITATAATSTISLAAASLAPGVSCSFTVNVTADGTTTGLVTNTTGAVTSVQSPAGNAATANLFIGDPFQVTYAANLSVGDSVINITNSGASGASLQSGTTASITGAICANVFAFTPDEQLVSCCSCPVTPNGLVSLSAKNDLASNTLTPAVPTALVVKVIATLPVGGSCNNSAAAVTTLSLANGLKSYGSTIHATPVAGSFGVTETPFSPATLSAGELSRVGNLCNFILANGSGFGVCRSCRLGGLGSERQ